MCTRCGLPAHITEHRIGQTQRWLFHSTYQEIQKPKRTTRSLIYSSNSCTKSFDKLYCVEEAGGAENLPPPPVIQPRHRDAERRDAGGDGGNGAGNAEPSVTQNQQQATDSSAMRRVTALPDLIPTTDNTSAPPEAPIPPPRRGAPSYGVRPPRPPPRRPRRRRSTCCDDKTPGVPSDHTTCEDWQRIGKQLRKIAIDFRGSGLEAEGPQTPQPLHNTKEEESLLSLLLPSPLSGSILTAVIFLVGWRFLARRG